MCTIFHHSSSISCGLYKGLWKQSKTPLCMQLLDLYGLNDYHTTQECSGKIICLNQAVYVIQDAKEHFCWILKILLGPHQHCHFKCHALDRLQHKIAIENASAALDFKGSRNITRSPTIAAWKSTERLLFRWVATRSSEIDAYTCEFASKGLVKAC